MFNPSVQNSVMSASDNPSDDTRFPTDGFKSLLKNSELLELLLKPMDKTEEVDCNSRDPSELLNTQLDLDLPSLIDDPKSKSLFDWENSDEYLECKEIKLFDFGFKKIKIYLFFFFF